MVGEVGFEPTKPSASDLQSDNFEPLVYSPGKADNVRHRSPASSRTALAFH